MRAGYSFARERSVVAPWRNRLTISVKSRLLRRHTRATKHGKIQNVKSNKPTYKLLNQEEHKMKDMTIIANKKIVNKETKEVRQVVSIDEENRKIFSVPVDKPDAEPTVMAAAAGRSTRSPRPPLPRTSPSPAGPTTCWATTRRPPRPRASSLTSLPPRSPRPTRRPRRAPRLTPPIP